MSHAKSLRVIGQAVEAMQVTSFTLEKHDDSYQVWIAKQLFYFSPADISRLDAQAQKRRRNPPTSATQPPKSLSQQLRALGGHLDRTEVCSFRLVWSGDSAILDYERVNGERNYKAFTAEELRQLGLHRSLLRSGRYLFPQLDP